MNVKSNKVKIYFLSSVCEFTLKGYIILISIQDESHWLITNLVHVSISQSPAIISFLTKMSYPSHQDSTPAIISFLTRMSYPSHQDSTPAISSFLTRMSYPIIH